MDRDSSVGIATRYGLIGLRIEFLWARDFPHPSRPTLEPTQPHIEWVVGLFSVGKVARRGVALATDPNLVPRYRYVSTLLLDFHGMLQGELFT